MRTRSKLCWAARLAYLLLGSAFSSSSADRGHVASSQIDKSDGVMLSRPTRPAKAPYYPARSLLDCEGSNFSAKWSEFRVRVVESQRAGFPEDFELYSLAGRLLQESEESMPSGSMKMPQVWIRQIPVSRLGGFCLYGYATALFILYRHTLDSQYLESIEAAMGWPEWPLDFMESSLWPTLWRMVPLHLERVRAGGELLRVWGEDFRLLPRPTVAEVEKALDEWVGRDSLIISSAVRGRFAARQIANVLRVRDRSVWILVLGHHMGSSMEPFTMLREALRVGLGDGEGAKVQADFCGQRHPKPGLVCKEFGYCSPSADLERWFRDFENRWLGEFEWMLDSWDKALDGLASVVGANKFMMQSDILVCGGPAWFCTMLRTMLAIPMLMYFAWPITPLVPSALKPHVLAQIQALGQTVEPPVVIVTANWILAAQFAAQIGLRVPVQRPHGLYANRTYAPVAAPDGRPRVMVTRVGQWARHSGVALLELTWLLMEQEQRESGRRYPFDIVFLSIKIRGTDTNRPLRYSEFAGFHACIFWPWDAMMLLFNELYTMTVPLLVPDPRWMAHLMLHSLRHTDVNWWHLRPGVAGRLPKANRSPFPLPYLPWLGPGDGLAEASYWYELTDFVQFPHVTTFGSLPEMLDRVRALDVDSLRAGMHAFNARTLRESLDFYREAAAWLLTGG